MTLTVVSGFILMGQRRFTMQVIPKSIRVLWREWELRALIFLSLTAQLILICLGNHRKYNFRITLKCAVWSAYLLADSVATMALGVLLNNLGEVYEDIGSLGDNNELAAFWAPFLLLHLGGPDTITAYSLEDNELYLRHALQLVVQTVTTIYIFLMAWNGSHISILTMPMILVGCLKYGERTWALWLASREQLRNRMLTPPEAGPNYAKFMSEYTLKHEEGFIVEAKEVKETRVEIDVSTPGTAPTSDANIVKAHAMFKIFKCLFADLILSFHDREASQSLFQKLSHEDAFNVIAIELGFMYDMLYTKAEVVYTGWGLARRAIIIALTCLVFVFFLFVDRQKYLKVNLLITFLLLLIAIVLDIFSAVLLLMSDQSSVWFIKNPKNKSLFKATEFLKVLKSPRWSNSMGQYSLISLCLEEKPPRKILKLLHLDELWEKHSYKTSKEVPECLKKVIFKHVSKNSRGSGPQLKENNRGSRTLDKYNLSSPIGWSMEGDFDQSILIWHIATELCNYSATWDNNSDDINRRLSKLLSRYMMFLQILYPFLLPVGIGLIRFRDTCQEARRFFEERMSGENYQKRARRIRACKMLLKVKTDVRPIKVKGDRSKSVLFDACSLASALNEISDTKKRWKMVRDVWLEMLTYAASQGRGSQHAQQLKRGGELLTHVWLLMAHFGLTGQFQISQGHARAKLYVK
ncbi:uncharacterized protein LOC102612510 [Citrus sinensis]|nr:uncharacterized protein LOC102612510 [Citrus sinensis]